MSSTTVDKRSVLAALISRLYNNDLPNKPSEETVIAMFTDNVSILMTANNKVNAECLAQTEVDIVSQCS